MASSPRSWLERLSRSILVGVLFGLAACTFDPLDLDGLTCPCGTGYVCNDMTRECELVEPLRDVPTLPDSGRDIFSQIDVIADSDSGDVATRDAGFDSGSDALNDMGQLDVPGDTSVSRPGCEAHTSSLLCEDFESGVADWSVFGDGVTGVDMTRAYSGTHSLRSIVTRDQTDAAISQWLPAEISSGDLYFRLNFFLAEPEGRPSLLVVSQRAAPYHGFTLSVRENRIEAFFYEESRGVLSADTLVGGAWNCIEGSVDIRQEDGSFEFSLNGGTRTVLSGLDTHPGPAGFGSVNVGVTFNPAGEVPATVFSDDLVIDDEPVPCD